MTTTRAEALSYVIAALDDALSVRSERDAAIPAHARLVGWQCGFEPAFVAVWSYLDVQLDDDEAADIAKDYLNEIGWFSNPDSDNEPDYII
jgi:hypothetical protein